MTYGQEFGPFTNGDVDGEFFKENSLELVPMKQKIPEDGNQPVWNNWSNWNSEEQNTLFIVEGLCKNLPSTN